MFRRIRDLDVYYEIVGEGRALLAVHGMGVDHRVMRGCLEPIFTERDEGWQRVYFDLPGMGQTRGADWIKSSDDMVGLVLAFVDAVMPGERFLIAGESYGGYLARAMIRERPQWVDGLLLLCPLAIADDAKRDVPPCSVLKRDDALVGPLPEDERQMLDLFLVDQSERNWGRFNEEMMAGFQAGDAAFKARIRQVESYQFSFDVDDLAAPFNKPCLILTGRQDCLAGYRDAWSFLENYPRGTFAVLDKAGHGLQIEQEALFNALVHEWLDRVKEEHR